MPSYPSGMTVSNRALRLLADALRARRARLRTRWRRLTAGRQALLVVAHLRKGETYADLATGFAVGRSTVYRYLTEGLSLLAAMAPTLEQAMAVAAGKAYAILDGSLLRIDRVAMASGNDRPYYSGKHKAHGLNVQVIADPAGRLIWMSPPLPGARHDLGAHADDPGTDCRPSWCEGVGERLDHLSRRAGTRVGEGRGVSSARPTTPYRPASSWTTSATRLAGTNPY